MTLKHCCFPELDVTNNRRAFIRLQVCADTGVQNHRIVTYLFLKDKQTSTADGKVNSPCSPKQGINFRMKNFCHCQLWHGYTTCGCQTTCLEVPYVSLSTKIIPGLSKGKSSMLQEMFVQWAGVAKSDKWVDTGWTTTVRFPSGSEFVSSFTSSTPALG